MTRKFVRIFVYAALLVLVLAIVLPASADGPDFVEVPNLEESPNGIYIVQLADKPVVAYEGDIKGLKATKPANGKKIDPFSPAVVNYVDYLTTKHDAALDKVGGGRKVYDYSYSFNGFAAQLTLEQANQLSYLKEVVTIEPDQVYEIDTSTTPDFLGLTAEGGLYDLGFTGEDVIIGIVDSGIWPENFSFSDRTGTNGNDSKDGKLDYQQIPGWNGKCTPGEEFGASDCNQKLIGAQYFNAGWGGDAGIDADRPWEFNSARDYNGHGSHTASTSGGNAGVPAEIDGIDFGTVNGIAPRARIAVYKALWSTEDASTANGTGIDLVAAIDQAVADGVDVINYSVSGSRTNFLDAVEVSFLFAADAGIFVSTSAGNSGPTASTVAHNSPWLTTVAAGTHDRFFSGTVTLGDGRMFYGASLDSRGAGPADLVWAGDAGDNLCHIGSLDPAVVAGKIVVCDRGEIARVDKSYAVMMAGGIGMVHANVGPGSINADLHSVPSVHVYADDGDEIRAYAQTSGATATLTGGVPEVAEAPDVAGFSSRGPSLASADLLKPDIMAPGVDILAAVAPPGNLGRNFDIYSGTSMSAPHIAGIAALLIDAHPDWSPMMVKSAIMTTAATMTNFGNPIDGTPLDYGAGQVVPNSAVDPGLVYDAGWVDWLGFLCGTGQLQASYCPSIGIDPSNLNYPSIAIGSLAGNQTVYRTVTNVGPAGTYEVSVDAPAGIDVVVTPSSFTLGKGESASYTVEFTANDLVQANQWTFGSLTWSDGVHNVTSTIAIFPKAVDAPVELHFSGTEGAANFDITFGYTGDFEAAPLGLEAAVMEADTVEDDPNDSFVFLGPGTNYHIIEVPAGSVYARFSLFDDYTDGNDDLDLYVYYLVGNSAYAVGSSGSGTSAEQVDIPDPDPGLYLVFVHGWQTDGPDANYTLFGWAFGPDAGNMTVTGPAAAVLSTTETVGIEWSGLDAGTKYLGAVGYYKDGGLVEMTLVGVDTD